MPRAADVELRAKNEASAAARDIGPPPDPAKPNRRDRASNDLARFLKYYFRQAFAKPFSRDHLEVIDTAQSVIENGGRYALAMPRGSGKTTICTRAGIWAVLTGRRRFVELIGSTEDAARRLLKSIKAELWQNDLLFADFPRELWGLPQLNGDARKAGGQLCLGEKTNITWSAKELILPTIDGSPCSSSVFYTAGLTGHVRGPQHRLPTGEIARPDLAILDDPQTRESARSREQTQTREEIIEGDVMGLAGPGKTIATLMPCTVIEPGDLADSYLDQDKHRAWQHKRTKTIYSFPANLPLWDEYYQILCEGLRVDGSPERGNAFYAARRAEMDDGARVAWKYAYEPPCLSALQHAMNLYLANPVAFAAEYQNEPIGRNVADADTPTCDGLDAKVNSLPALTVPLKCSKLTAFVDVQGKLLYYAVTAWDESFGGCVIDYGCYPRQERLYYTLANAQHTIQTLYPGSDAEGGIALAAEALLTDLCSRSFVREDGLELRISRLLIDSGYQADVIYEVTRRSNHAAVVLPSKGQAIQAGQTPMTELERKQTQSPGWHWCLTTNTQKRRTQLLRYDTNHWKTFLAARIAAPRGNRGSLEVFGERPEQHRLLADHLSTERPEMHESKGQRVWQWDKSQVGADNHLLDCLVGCCAAASLIGISLDSAPQQSAPQRRVIQFPDHLRRRS